MSQIVNVFLTSPLRYKILAITIFFLPFTDVGRLNIIKPAEVTLVILMAIFYADYSISKEKLRNFYLMRILLVFFIYLTFASIIAPAIPEEAYNYDWYEGIFNKNKNLFYLLRVFFLVSSYYVFMRMISTYKDYVFILKILIVSTILYICILTITSLIVPDIVFIQGGDYSIRFRLKGFSSEPNSFSVWLYSVYFLFLALSCCEMRDIGVSKKIIRTCFGILNLLLVLTFSATAYIAIAVGLVLFLYNYYRKVKILIKDSYKWLLLPIKFVSLVVSILLVIIIFAETVSPSFYNVIFGKLINYLSIYEMESGPRGLSLITSLRIFLAYPVFGVGIGKSPYFMNIFYPFSTYLANYKPSVTSFHPLNSYTLFLCETGIVGILFLTIIVYKVYKCCNFRSLNKIGRINALYTTSTMTAFSIGMLGSGDIHYQIYFVLSIVILIKNYQLNKEKILCD